MALGTSAIIRETTQVVKRVLKPLLNRTRAPPDYSSEDGSGQALLDREIEDRCETADDCEYLPDTDSHATVRTKSWV